WRKIQRRPIIAPEDVSYVARALPDAQAISLQSGWPTPTADVQWRNRTVGDVLVFGVTPPFVVVQDYAFAAGTPFTDVDQRQRRAWRTVCSAPRRRCASRTGSGRDRRTTLRSIPARG